MAHIPEYQTQILDAHRLASLEEAVSLIQTRQVVAFPTDTVYGLGATISSPEAINQLYAVKGRDAAKAIAVLLGDRVDLDCISAAMGGAAERLAQCFWPGALTLVVMRRPTLPDNLSPTPTIGVRMPNHPVAMGLLRRTGPLAVTSANLSNAANTTNAQEVLAQLQGRIPLILDGGRTPGGSPSTVVDCTVEPPVILRPGPITLDQILAVLENSY